MTAEDSIQQPPVKKQAEIGIVSNLRGFAAMSVFLFHLVCVSNGYISDKLLYLFFSYGKYGVQFFFVISGFVITYSMLKGNYTYRNFFTFLKKRLIRIEPPYLVIVLLTVIFLIVRNKSGAANGDEGMPGIIQVLLHIGYLIPFSAYGWLSIVFWTLAIEFQFYLLFSVLFQLYTGNKWGRWLLQAMLLVLFFNSGDEAFFFHWSPVFLLGINLALFKMKLVDMKELAITILLLAACIFFKTGWEVLVFSLVPFTLIYLEPRIKSRVWDFFGRISYSLYLCHTLVAFAIINIGFRYTHHFYQKVFFVSLAFGVTVLCSYLLYYFVEKPFKRIASAIKYSN